MPRNKKNKQSGFTLVELLVAMAIFALFITISASSLVNVLKIEQKANVLRQTESGARYILETISREARSANGEFDANGARITAAYSVPPGTTLFIFSTDFSVNPPKVTEVKYFAFNDLLYRYVYEKSIGSPSYTPKSSTTLNNANDIKITIFSASVSNPPDLLTPPKLTMTLQAQSGKNVGAIKTEYSATVDLKTSVSPRNY